MRWQHRPTHRIQQTSTDVVCGVQWHQPQGTAPTPAVEVAPAASSTASSSSKSAKKASQKQLRQQQQQQRQKQQGGALHSKKQQHLQRLAPAAPRSLPPFWKGSLEKLLHIFLKSAAAGAVICQQLLKQNWRLLDWLSAGTAVNQSAATLLMSSMRSLLLDWGRKPLPEGHPTAVAKEVTSCLLACLLACT
jgi:hypothetical protein